MRPADADNLHAAAASSENMVTATGGTPLAAAPAITPAMRTLIENVIEDLLLLLDELDGDADLELL